MNETNRILHAPIVLFGDASITLAQILAVLLLVLLGGLFVVWSARGLRRLLNARSVSPDLVQILSRAWLIIGLVVLAFIVLDYLNVPLTAFAFISGAVAIGVGFGAQNIINNFISGWILMWERPIKIGDFLELSEVHGTVESIDTRSTRIRRLDGVHVLVPNSFLLENSVTNWTLVDRLVRTSVRVGVAYGSDVVKVTELLKQAADEHENVLKEPERAVIFDDFGDSALIFELTVWVYAGAERGLRIIRSDLRYRITELFNQNGVVIAFPQTDIHVDGSLKLEQASSSA